MELKRYRLTKTSAREISGMLAVMCISPVVMALPSTASRFLLGDATSSPPSLPHIAVIPGCGLPFLTRATPISARLDQAGSSATQAVPHSPPMNTALDGLTQQSSRRPPQMLFTHVRSGDVATATLPTRILMRGLRSRFLRKLPPHKRSPARTRQGTRKVLFHPSTRLPSPTPLLLSTALQSTLRILLTHQSQMQKFPMRLSPAQKLQMHPLPAPR